MATWKARPRLCVWCVRVLFALRVVFFDESFDTGEIWCSLRPSSAVLLLILHVLNAKVLHVSATCAILWVDLLSFIFY